MRLIARTLLAKGESGKVTLNMRSPQRLHPGRVPGCFRVLAVQVAKGRRSMIVRTRQDGPCSLDEEWTAPQEKTWSMWTFLDRGNGKIFTDTDAINSRPAPHFTKSRRFMRIVAQPDHL